MVIYKATNRINDRSYIGQSIFNLGKRKRDHICQALSKADNMYFHKAIRKHGKENFDWEILHECDGIKELNKLEIYYIKKYDTFLSDGYNLNAGGMNARPSKETRRKMSIAKKGKNHPMYGKNFSEERKRKIAEAQMAEKNHRFGKKISDGHKQRLSEANAGRGNPMCGIHKCGKDAPHYGKKHSEETIQKMSGKNHPGACPITVNNKCFDTITEAAITLNVTHAAICYRLKNQWTGYQYAK